MARKGSKPQSAYLPRLMEPRILQALRAFRVVVLTGARQTGKTTLVLKAPWAKGRDYRTLDDYEVLDLARKSPEELVRAAPRMTLDEVQQAPGLLKAIKRQVDKDNRPGQFLLTGSANLLLMRKVAESLAGRALYLKLAPMTESEKLGRPDPGPWMRMLKNDQTVVLSRELQRACMLAGKVPAAQWKRQILQGGYPAVVQGPRELSPTDWFESYLRTYLERDLQEISEISNLPDYRRLMKFAALWVGQVVSQTRLGRDAGLRQYTAHRYLNLLETTFQIHRLPSFSLTRSKPLVKAPKLYWTDPGLAAHLAQIRSTGDFTDGLFGALSENLLLVQLLAWRETMSPKPELYYWRTRAGEEVDLVIEHESRLLPIELKMSKRVTIGDASGLRAFLSEHPKRAPLGILLYGGTDLVPLVDRILAVPLATVIPTHRGFPSSRH